jgi:hypothetical protein
MDEGGQCLKTGLLPITTYVGGQIETTWKINHCDIPPNGLTDTVSKLQWAGDLDGDGKLDLLVHLPDHPSAGSFLLLLSKSTTAGTVFQYSLPENPGC